MLQDSPHPVSWVAPAAPVPGCPPGLENLIPLDYLLVQQQMEVLEMSKKYESPNKYLVKNRLGQNLFFVQEHSSFYARACFPCCRPYRMDFTDITQRVVIQLHQPSVLFCKQIIVEAPPGEFVGRIDPMCSLHKPMFKVIDSTGKAVFLIKGPRGYFMCDCCRQDVLFKVLSLDERTEVGSICKMFGGMVELLQLTDADNYTISFPVDVDVRLKAVLLAVCLLIDMMFFESTTSVLETTADQLNQLT